MLQIRSGLLEVKNKTPTCCHLKHKADNSRIHKQGTSQAGRQHSSRYLFSSAGIALGSSAAFCPGPAELRSTRCKSWWGGARGKRAKINCSAASSCVRVALVSFQVSPCCNWAVGVCNTPGPLLTSGSVCLSAQQTPRALQGYGRCSNC